MAKVRAKKHLGQHFLLDENVAIKTVEAFGLNKSFKHALEIGPGMGVLTKYLIEKEGLEIKVIDIDQESIEYLHSQFDIEEDRIIYGDFLQLNLMEVFDQESIGIIGNFPYNISSQILFKAYENNNQVLEVVGMFQKEVAERVTSPPGSKAYGILSVLLQSLYDVEYLFTVPPEVFDPPPKVQSAVIRLVRNFDKKIDCDDKKFKMVIKVAFNQRRKTLRNSLKSILDAEKRADKLFDKRPEQLSIEEFVSITKML
jgi:16S rRNA (adenine1518-N6/adenine1519-N6)-dimethyltransferase